LEPRRRDSRADRLSPAPPDTATGRALVIEPTVRGGSRSAAPRAAAAERTPAAKLDEAVGLARAIDLDVPL